MATFNKRDTVWTAALAGYAEKGFTLTPSQDGEILTLRHEGKKIAELVARRLTPEALLIGCRNYLQNIALV